MCATRCCATERMPHSHEVPCAGEAPTLALPLARRSGGPALGLRCLAARVRDPRSWQRSSVTPIFYQHLSVDDGIVDAPGESPDTPPAGREVVHHIFGKRFHGVGIKNGNVSGHTGTEQPAIVDAEGRG